MRDFRTYIFVLVLTLSAVSGSLAENRQMSAKPETTPQVSWLRRVFCHLSWKELPVLAKSPKAACAIIRHHVIYKTEARDSWASGKDTWDRGFGDCEDMAQAIVDLCSKKGFKAEVLVLYPPEGSQAHAVATGELNGKRWISSNGSFEYFKSFKKAKSRIARDMGWDRDKKIISVAKKDFTQTQKRLVAAASFAPVIIMPQSIIR